MPRLARLDTPGIMHHVMIRGIERKKIFRDNKDRDNLLERISSLIPETNTACYAWALLPNHAHFLFRTGDVELSTLMRRLLTGYAVSFNRKYELKLLGYNLEKVEDKVAEIFHMEREELYERGREKRRVKARSLLFYWAVRELGLSGTFLADRFRMSLPGVVYAVYKGEKIAKENGYRLTE